MTLLELGKQTLVQRMLLIRAVENVLQDLCNEGLAGDLHFSKGQEAISVGVCAALRETDYIVTHHRTIAHAIAKGVPLEPLLAEILGQDSGINGGVAGEMHLSYPKKRLMFSWQLVGTCVPVAAGLAWAVKNHLKTDDVVVVFHGDAATANGQWHEGVNLAAVQHLPLLLVCENNHLAGNVRPKDYQPFHHAGERMRGHGTGFSIVNGNNVERVRELTAHALSFVRHEQRPFMLECDTTRLGRHKQGQGDLRSAEEMVELRKRDPLKDTEPQELASLESEVTDIIRKILGQP